MLHGIEVRRGVGEHDGSDGFHSTAVASRLELPFRWEPGGGFHIQAWVDFSAGWLGRSAEDALFASAGPALTLGHESTRLTLDAGISPTFLSEEKFGGKDLGGEFQFTDSIGITYLARPCWTIGYRLAHISNAGIYYLNPGINLHIMSIGYSF